MTTKAEATPEQQVLELKAKLFDLIEEHGKLVQANQDLSTALQHIAGLAGVVPNEEGQVTLDELVKSVQNRLELELDPTEAE